MTMNRLRLAAHILAPVLVHFGAHAEALSDLRLWLDSEERAAKDARLRKPRPMSIRAADGVGPPTKLTRGGHSLTFVHVWADGEHDLAVEVLHKKSEDDPGTVRMFPTSSLCFPIGFSPRAELRALAASDDGW